MRKDMFAAALALLFTAVGAAGYVLSPALGPKIEVTLLSPRGNPQGVIDAAPTQVVKVVVEVKNTGRASASNLYASAGCQCHIKSALPASLAPGESTQLEMQIPAPPAGSGGSFLNVMTTGVPEPLAAVQIPVHVAITAPTWFVRSDSASFTEISDTGHAHAIHLEAIERRDQPAWLRGVAFESADFGEPALSTEQRPCESGEIFVYRKYRVDFSLPKAKPGTHKTVLHLNGEGSPLGEMAVRVDVLPLLTVVPPEVSLGATQQSRRRTRVTIVARAELREELTVLYDKEAIEVERINAQETGKHEYEIRACGAPTSSFDTEVSFVDSVTHALASLYVHVTPP